MATVRGQSGSDSDVDLKRETTPSFGYSSDESESDFQTPPEEIITKPVYNTVIDVSLLLRTLDTELLMRDDTHDDVIFDDVIFDDVDVHPSSLPAHTSLDVIEDTDFDLFNKIDSFLGEQNNESYSLKEPIEPRPVEPHPEKPIELRPVEPRPEEPVEPRPEKPIEPRPEEPVEPHPEKPIELRPVEPRQEEPVEPHPEKPIEPRPEEPVDPLPEEPVDPLPEEPVEPLPEEPVEPLPEEPVEPLPEEPVDPLPEEPVDPLPEEPVDPLPEEPVKPVLQDKCVITDNPAITDTGSQTNVVTVCDASMNTELVVEELLQLVTLNLQSKANKDKYQKVLVELNEEKSQRMVNDQLIKIVQLDITSLQQRNVTETTNRLQQENELVDLKAEYVHSQNEVKEKQTRVTELEESLSGTMLLVRKLEEQSATILNKGGIDYLLQAKIADGRAHEAEQRMEVLQAELLQSQTEVKRLLERMNELSRGRQEMVSGPVHTQLLQISDERAVQAETRMKELELEVLKLKSGRGTYPVDPLSLGHTPFSFGSKMRYDDSPFYSSTRTSFTSDTLSNREGFPPYTSDTLGKREGFPPYASDTLGKREGFPPYTSDTLGKREGFPPITSEDPMSFSSFLNQNSYQWQQEETTPTTSSQPKDTTPTSPPTIPLLPAITDTFTKQGDNDEQKNDTSEEDWSSSEEEDNSFRPSVHMNLRSKFEWLSSQQDTPISEPLQVSLHMTTPTYEPETPPRRVPPPIAPKPKGFRQLSSNETIHGEGPVSFNEMTRPPSLKLYVRARGAIGRRLPSYI